MSKVFLFVFQTSDCILQIQKKNKFHFKLYLTYYIYFIILKYYISYKKQPTGPMGTAFAGGTAGLCLWTFIFPIDVVKTRIQVLAAAGKQEGFAQTLRIIVRTEGRVVFSFLQNNFRYDLLWYLTQKGIEFFLL